MDNSQLQTINAYMNEGHSQAEIAAAQAQYGVTAADIAQAQSMYGSAPAAPSVAVDQSAAPIAAPTATGTKSREDSIYDFYQANANNQDAIREAQNKYGVSNAELSGVLASRGGYSGPGYMAANPDVLAQFLGGNPATTNSAGNLRTTQGMTQDEFAQWHWQNYGKNEGRLGMVQMADGSYVSADRAPTSNLYQSKFNDDQLKDIARVWNQNTFSNSDPNIIRQSMERFGVSAADVSYALSKFQNEGQTDPSRTGEWFWNTTAVNNRLQTMYGKGFGGASDTGQDTTAAFDKMTPEVKNIADYQRALRGAGSLFQPNNSSNIPEAIIQSLGSNKDSGNYTQAEVEHAKSLLKYGGPRPWEDPNWRENLQGGIQGQKDYWTTRYAQAASSNADFSFGGAAPGDGSKALRNSGAFDTSKYTGLSKTAPITMGTITRAKGLQIPSSTENPNNSATTQATSTQDKVNPASTTTATSQDLAQLGLSNYDGKIKYHDGTEVDAGLLKKLYAQIAPNVGSMGGGILSEKGQSVGFDYDQASKLFGTAPTAQQQVALDMAYSLQQRGITDLSQLTMGKRTVVDPNADGELDPQDKPTIQVDALGYKGADGKFVPIDGNIGATYSGKGNTQYELGFDQKTGKPTFSSIAQSSQDDWVDPALKGASLFAAAYGLNGLLTPATAATTGATTGAEIAAGDVAKNAAIGSTSASAPVAAPAASTGSGLNWGAIGSKALQGAAINGTIAAATGGNVLKSAALGAVGGAVAGYSPATELLGMNNGLGANVVNGLAGAAITAGAGALLNSGSNAGDKSATTPGTNPTAPGTTTTTPGTTTSSGTTTTAPGTAGGKVDPVQSVINQIFPGATTNTGGGTAAGGQNLNAASTYGQNMAAGAIPLLSEQADNGRGLRSSYTNDYKPYDRKFMDYVDSVGTEAYRAQQRGRAVNSVQQQSDQQRGALARQMAASGVNPNSGRMAAMSSSIAQQTALNKVIAAMGADRNARDEWSKGLGAINAMGLSVAKLGQQDTAQAVDIARLGLSAADMASQAEARLANTNLQAGNLGLNWAKLTGDNTYRDKQFEFDKSKFEWAKTQNGAGKVLGNTIVGAATSALTNSLVSGAGKNIATSVWDWWMSPSKNTNSSGALVDTNTIFPDAGAASA